MFGSRRCRLAAFALALALAAPGAAEAQRAAAGPADWPCVQRLIPELAWGAVWAGPSIDELEQDWWEDEEVGRIVRFATSREVSREEAIERVRAFVEEVDEDRERRLTLLFAGLFEEINEARARTIEAVRRFARGQVDRLERISELVDELEELRRNDAVRDETLETLEKELFWEQRVFKDRQSSLRALCDQPYLLEERLSRFARVVQPALQNGERHREQ